MSLGTTWHLQVYPIIDPSPMGEGLRWVQVKLSQYCRKLGLNPGKALSKGHSAVLTLLGTVVSEKSVHFEASPQTSESGPGGQE